MSVHTLSITVKAPHAGNPNDSLAFFKDQIAAALNKELSPGVEGTKPRSLKEPDAGIVESITLAFNLKQ